MPGDTLHHVTNVGPGATIGVCSRPWRSGHLRTVRRNRFRNATGLERGTLADHIAKRCIDQAEYEEAALHRAREEEEETEEERETPAGWSK